MADSWLPPEVMNDSAAMARFLFARFSFLECSFLFWRMMKTRKDDFLELTGHAMKATGNEDSGTARILPDASRCFGLWGVGRGA